MTPLFVGTFSVAGPYFHARGRGLWTAGLDETSGAVVLDRVVAPDLNPVWLTRAGGQLLVASENYFAPGELRSFRASAGDGLTPAGSAHASEGGGICHIEVLPASGQVAVCSYFGSLTVHDLRPDGELGPTRQEFRYPGRGPVADRQDRSHPHQARLSPDGRSVWVCDLGTDSVWVHAVGPHGLDQPVRTALPPGSGPRHLVFHRTGPWASVLGELDGHLRTLGLDGRERADAAVNILPSGSPGGGACSLLLHPVADILYATDRPSNTLTTAQAGAAGGPPVTRRLALEGRTPRDAVISPSGRWLVLAFQDSDTVQALELDPDSGWPTGRSGPALSVGSPFSLAF